ncbi:unnamed protein product [Euphydryas editha]|uniref:Zinc finger protein n=1 Tax=Euphydryas editha TaxID=104508 RepID=A0AAU9UVF2_EUPED|nr:unnamed protein product [Euphydryas editha]
MTEIWNLNALCRCCHADGCFSNINSPSNIMGSMELFSDLLKDTFDIQLHSPPIEVSHMICDKCIKHLQDGALFKKQIMECELKFQEYCRNELLQHVNIKLEKDVEDNDFIVKTELVLKDGDNDSLCETGEMINCTENESPVRVKIKNIEEQSRPEEKIKRTTVRSKKNPERIICTLCQIDFTDKKSLKKHNSEKHTSLNMCIICDIKFKTPKTYARHMYYHSICKDPTIPLAKMNKFDCNTCPKSYRNIRLLRNHRNTHTRENIYTCDLCKKEFLYKNILRKHILWHTGRNKQYMCDTCGSSFNDNTNLNKHIITVHKKLKPFKCTLCPKEFAANKTLKIHMRLHTGERPYICNLCDAKFIQITNLNEHRKKHELKKQFGGIYICKICQSVFDHRGIYRSHLRSHVTARVHKCVECNENFSNKFSLKRHMETHITLKKFSCDKCVRKFATASKLKSHGRCHDPNRIKKVKTEKINCELCKKAVTDIEKHMKTHYNRRHRCDYCDNAYSERNALNRHVKQSHDGVRHECDVCEKKFVRITSLKIHKMKVHNFELKKNKESE